MINRFALPLFLFRLGWTWQAVKLVVSPLWFMGVYLMLVLVLPCDLAARALRHDRPRHPGGLAGLVDVARFRYDVPSSG